MLEAMRGGLPIIATNVGGTGEAITDGVHGFLIPRGDADRLSQRLRELSADPPRRAAMGAAARRRYEEMFTSEQMVAQTWAVYESAICAATSSSRT
jgi:glycosyltransferase involved in cell wall biosynthesis